MRAVFLILTLSISVTLGGCTQFPELNAAVSPEAETADFPALVPLEPLLAARAGRSEAERSAIADDLTSRIARLRARAAGLRGDVIDPQSRNRLTRRSG